MKKHMKNTNWTPARIKALRDRYGETQDEFARRFRISTSAVRAWEQGQGSPSGPATIVFDHLEQNAPELQLA